MRGKERALLRSRAHKLAAIVHVGQEGITAPLIASLDDALRTHELVKVSLGKRLAQPVQDAAGALARATASEVVQVIGRTCTLYRAKVEPASD
ncbi:MAG: YhbY family RNA-binding protein [Gemmatimonadaceae bacterium]